MDVFYHFFLFTHVKRDTKLRFVIGSSYQPNLQFIMCSLYRRSLITAKKFTLYYKLDHL